MPSPRSPSWRGIRSGELGISADAWTTLQRRSALAVGAHLPDALASAAGFLGIAGPPDRAVDLATGRFAALFLVSRDTPTGAFRVGIAADAGGAFELDFSTPVPALALQVDAGHRAGVVHGALAFRHRCIVGRRSAVARFPHSLPPCRAAQRWPPPSTTSGRACSSPACCNSVLSTFAPGVRMDRIEAFLRDSGTFLRNGLNGAAIQTLLQQINLFAGLPDWPWPAIARRHFAHGGGRTLGHRSHSH